MTYKVSIFRITLLIVSFFLTGCDKEKIPLSGKREAFIPLDFQLKPDPSISTQNRMTKIQVPIVNNEWLQNTFNCYHSIPVLSISDHLTLKWSVPLGQSTSDYQRLLSTIVVSENVAYGLNTQGIITALKIDSSKPTILWKKPLASQHSSQEILGGGLAIEVDRIFATTSDGEILSLDKRNGEILWRANVSIPIRTPPTVKNGQVFALTISNEVFCFDANTGHQKWSHSGIPEQSALLGGSSPAVADDVVIVAYSSGEIYALQVENGHPLWSDTLSSTARIDTVSSIPHIHACPVINKEQVFAVSHGGRMVAIDLKTGVRQWQREIGGTQTPVITDEWVFVVNSHGEVFCLDRHSGLIKWVSSLPHTNEIDKEESIFWSGPIIANSELVFVGSNGEVRFIDIKDGKRSSKSLKIERAFFLPPIIVNKTLYVLTNQAELYAWS